VEIKFTSIQAINKLLQEGEPGNVSTDTYTGFSGYNLQAIVDATNEVLGFENWGYDEIYNELTEDKALAISSMKVWLGERDNYKTAYGQSRITRGDIGDGKKGAQTDAVKKCFSMFSIGSRAYLGLLDRKGQNKASKMPYNQSAPQNVSDAVSEGKTTEYPAKQKDYTGPTAKVEKPEHTTALSRTYFAVAKNAGYESEDAKSIAKKAYKVDSFNKITNVQLTKLVEKFSVRKKIIEAESSLLDELNKSIPNVNFESGGKL